MIGLETLPLGVSKSWRRRAGAGARAVVLVWLVVGLVGCSRSARAPELPPIREMTSVGVGDVFELRIVGEDKLPTEYQVASDGTADLPYIHRVTVAGLEPQQITDLVRTKLIEQKVYSDPSVSVMVKAYNSKRIEVLGEVHKPGSFPIEPGMTLLRAISLAGGFNSLADQSRVTIRRRLSDGTTKAATVDVDGILESAIPDIPLQAGDSVNVAQRVF